MKTNPSVVGNIKRIARIVPYYSFCEFYDKLIKWERTENDCIYSLEAWNLLVVIHHDWDCCIHFQYTDKFNWIKYRLYNSEYYDTNDVIQWKEFVEDLKDELEFIEEASYERTMSHCD